MHVVHRHASWQTLILIKINLRQRKDEIIVTQDYLHCGRGSNEKEGITGVPGEVGEGFSQKA